MPSTSIHQLILFGKCCHVGSSGPLIAVTAMCVSIVVAEAIVAGVVVASLQIRLYQKLYAGRLPGPGFGAGIPGPGSATQISGRTNTGSRIERVVAALVV